MTPANVISRQLDDIAAAVMSIDDATYVARPIAGVSGWCAGRSARLTR